MKSSPKRVKGRFKRSHFFSLYSLFETLIHRRLSETPIIINKMKDWLLGPRFYFEFIKPRGSRPYSSSVRWGGSGAHRRGEEADGDAPSSYRAP